MPNNINFPAADQTAFNANIASTAPDSLKLFARMFAFSDRMPRWKGLTRLRKYANPSLAYAIGTPTQAITVCRGSGAVVTPVVSGGAIASATVAGGTGYSATVTYVVTGGGGSSGALTGTVTGGVPNSPLTVSTPGTGYVSAPKVAIRSFVSGGTDTITGHTHGIPTVLTYTISNTGTAAAAVNTTPTLGTFTNIASATVTQAAVTASDPVADSSVANPAGSIILYPTEAIANAAGAVAVAVDTAVLQITINATAAGAFSALVTLPWAGGNFTWTISGTAA